MSSLDTYFAHSSNKLQENIEVPKSWTRIVQEQGYSSLGGKLKYFPPQSETGDCVPVIKPPKEFHLYSQKPWNFSLGILS